MGRNRGRRPAAKTHRHQRQTHQPKRHFPKEKTDINQAGRCAWTESSTTYLNASAQLGKCSFNFSDKRGRFLEN